jgi:hypothetical protein
MKGLKCIYDSKIRLFLSFWLLVFVLYLPAWRAGFVSDFTGWLYDLQNSSFLDHINRTHFKVKSLYQFTQLVTWFFYQLFGINHFLWHSLHVTLHAINVTLLFTICTTIFKDKERVQSAIFAACILCCISPSISEVIVWEPSFHYLLGFLMFLLIIRFVQNYLSSPQVKWLIAALLLFFISSFSIELFYATPFCVLGLILSQNAGSQIGQKSVLKSLKAIVLPLFLILGLHFFLVRIAYGHWLPHISADHFAQTELTILLSKPLKMLFHLLFFGRFFSEEFRHKIYLICESYKVLTAFYDFVVLLIAAVRIYVRKQAPNQSPILLIFYWTILLVGLTIPLWFPSTFWVVFDRYTYFSVSFIFIIISLPIYWVFPNWLSRILFLLFAVANVFALYKVNKKWAVTAGLIHQLMEELPQKSDKKVLLLNMPQCMNGVFMISANPQNEAQLIKSMLYTPRINYELIDVCGNNILSVNDGAHVKVLNDTTVRVMLNQWGTWWWYNDRGATNYEHPYFKRIMDEYGYNLILRGKPTDYLLLYQVGNHWKSVDWSNKDSDQY